MKAVLISLQPKWCELIASGKKTVEVRKTKPKMKPPFKCYIYCTLSGSNEFFKDFLGGDVAAWNRGKWGEKKGNVIGEFICDDIRWFDVPYPAFQKEMDRGILEQSCLTYYQLHRYAYHDALAAWHISGLVIYDEPKPLSKFRVPCREYQRDDPRCGNCDCYKGMGEYPPECACDGVKPIVRPPQSWCYVEVE